MAGGEKALIGEKRESTLGVLRVRVSDGETYYHPHDFLVARGYDRVSVARSLRTLLKKYLSQEEPAYADAQLLTVRVGAQPLLCLNSDGMRAVFDLLYNGEAAASAGARPADRRRPGYGRVRTVTQPLARLRAPHVAGAHDAVAVASRLTARLVWARGKQGWALRASRHRGRLFSATRPPRRARTAVARATSPSACVGVCSAAPAGPERRRASPARPRRRSAATPPAHLRRVACRPRAAAQASYMSVEVPSAFWRPRALGGEQNGRVHASAPRAAGKP